MNARFFLLPMQAPANGTGKGTRDDPWRPKYLRELGLAYSILKSPDRAFCLAKVWGDKKRIDELATLPDVEELLDSSDTLSADKLARASNIHKGLALARTHTERDLFGSIWERLVEKQVASRDAVKRG